MPRAAIIALFLAALVLYRFDARAAEHAGRDGAGVAPAASVGDGTALRIGFEEDNGGFAASGDWQWGTYLWAGVCPTSAPPLGPHSGEKMWGTVLNGCYANLGNNEGDKVCFNTVPGNDSVLSFTVSLTGLERPRLSWWEWFDVFLPNDWVEVYVNGWRVFERCKGVYVPPDAWERREVDLSAFAGTVVTVEFHMMSSTVIERSGWYIDDVTVEDPPAPPFVPAAAVLLLD